jgi:DsbC/DsbD-like thiol-disulfide interchange protein/cytochrome c biogenesis protein CcdA
MNALPHGLCDDFSLFTLDVFTMKKLLFLLFTFWVLIGSANAASIVHGQHYDARLISRASTASEGKPLALGLVLNPQKGWHIYWTNPGETGYAPAMDWTLPEGAVAGTIRHPVPKLLVLGGFASNVHEGETILLLDITMPASLPAGTPLHLKVKLDLLVCSESSCVPDPTILDITIKVGDGSADPATASDFARAEQALPIPGKEGATIDINKGIATLFLPGVARGNNKLHLFGGQELALSDSAPQQFKDVDGGMIATIKVGDARLSGALPVVISFSSTNSSPRGYSFIASQSADIPVAGSTRQYGQSLLISFGAALLGGLLLNLMPCVFPILSLKAMSLVRSGGNDRDARVEAVGYSIGAIGVILALGATLLILRAGGHALGWAFQLQDIRVVTLMLLLVTAIATNMAGLFEVPSMRFNGAAQSGFYGAVSTGALAAFIATPCTGPFMAGALGAALLLPPLASMAIFFGLGLGLAAPFLLLGFWKPARKYLPKPGAWMAKLRQILSLPMFATAIGLSWIVGRQGGVNAMALALAAALLLGCGLWWYGMRQFAGKRLWPVAAPVFAALFLAINLSAPTDKAIAAATAEQGVEPYSAARLVSLRSESKPVFLYMTADWCLSCKVNEATSLSANDVKSAFAKAGVIVMRGDWTNGDPAITAFLKEQGSAGVPLYLWYHGLGAPKEMPQVLTPSMLVALVSKSG